MNLYNLHTDTQINKQVVRKKITATTLLFIFFLGFSSYGHTAFCSLRDPVGAIKGLYPESTSFKSSVKIIDANIRDKVQELLPPNTLHFSELGKHTLYMVFKNDQPIGYVHVRSEESKWGLVEIAWAINLNLQVQDFQFQRCRSRQKSKIEDEQFRAQLRGKTYQEFTQMLMADGSSLNKDKITVNKKARGLAEIVIRCGMKTLLVTELAWSDEVTKNRISNNAFKYFNNAVTTDIVDKPINNSISTILNKAFGDADTGIDRSSVVVAKVYDNSQKVLGMIYESQITIDNSLATINWIMEPDGKIIHVENTKGWQEKSTQDAFEKTIGQQYHSSNQCNDRAELLTLEAVLTAKSALSL